MRRNILSQGKNFVSLPSKNMDVREKAFCLTSYSLYPCTHCHLTGIDSFLLAKQMATSVYIFDQHRVY